MYKKHARLKEPQNSRQKLWRYLKYARLVELINEGFLYFPHITNLKDKWEGLLTNKTKEKIFWEAYAECKNAEEARSATEEYEKHKDAFYINSWHMNDDESYLMWKAYGDRGCAIQTNYERLIASFDGELPEINGNIINYIDYERDRFDIANTFYYVSYKDIPYKDEKEFRLLYWKLNLTNQKLPADEKGVKVNIDVNMLIDNIYINPTNKIEISELEKLVKNKNMDCEIKYSKIKE